MKPLRLTIELVPQTSWYNNMRSYMSKEQWNTLRKNVFADFQHRCGICGVGGRLECHELWEYDDEHHVQNLTGYIPLCELCHRVKHIGLSELEGAKGNVDYEAVVRHFMSVNTCDRKIFEKHRSDSFELFNKRSAFTWTVRINNEIIER